MSTIVDTCRATMGDAPRVMLYRMSIQQRLEAAIKEAGKTQTEVARHARIGRGAVSAIVRGRTKNPQPDHLFAIADALGVEPRWLATGHGPKKKAQGLSQEQREWLEMYEYLPPAKRQAARAILDPAGEYRVDDAADSNS